jgi:hypothetical protein
VADERIVTAAELELMSPDERLELLRTRTVTDPSQLDPRFLADARADARAAYEERLASGRKST